MTPAEILSTYAELSQAEAFEAFEAASVDYGDIEAVLGEKVVRELSNWVYFNVK